ncbi:MAG: YHS domain-containing protein [Chloracidobacterium sp.]|nr:YHS domain-containing protein [Chloracidobacterium sp.]
MLENKTTTADTFIDPVCGMQVTPVTAVGTYNQDGETHYFCSTGCLQKFLSPISSPASCCSGN